MYIFIFQDWNYSKGFCVSVHNNFFSCSERWREGEWSCKGTKKGPWHRQEARVGLSSQGASAKAAQPYPVHTAWIEMLWVLQNFPLNSVVAPSLNFILTAVNRSIT